MHKRNLSLSLPPSLAPNTPPPHPRPALSNSPNCTQTWTCTQSGVDIRAHSQQIRVLTQMRPGTRSGTQARRKQACFVNTQCPHSAPPRPARAFHHLLGHAAPLAETKPTYFWGGGVKIKTPKTSFQTPPALLSPFHTHTDTHTPPPPIDVAWQACGADMFRICSGNGLIKNAKQLAITVWGLNGH